MSDSQSFALLGMGNPLLDIAYNCDEGFLEKYGLNPNDAVLISDKQAGLYEEVTAKLKCEKSAGGATLNTVRVFAALDKKVRESKQPSCTYIGCIGSDKDGEELKGLCVKSNIQSLMCANASTPTGICLVGVNGHNRSLCTRLGAAEKFESNFMEQKSVQDVIEKTKVFYGAGFFLTVSPKAIEIVAKHAAEKNKIYATNLSAEFLVEFFKEPMMKTIQFSDFVFGNETEFKLFGNVHGAAMGLGENSSLEDVASKVALLPKANEKRNRIVIITQGPNATIVASGDAVLKQVSVNVYPTNALRPEQIVDTNTAGDAFVGGFLFGISANLPVDKCIKYANFAAAHVIQRPGCDTNFVDVPDIA